MAELKTRGSKAISRRTFCRSAVAAATTAALAGGFDGRSVAAPAAGNRVKFFKNLGCGPIGVSADQPQALDYAVKYGFDGISPRLNEFEDKSASQIRRWVETMKAKNIRYGACTLPVQFKRPQDQVERDLAKLPGRAAIMRQLGIERVAIWIPPGHKELTYLQNFELHRKRYREIAGILDDNGMRLGLEFIGPRTSRSQSRFPFICTQKGMMELIEAIGRPNVGLLLDSWHWYTSHGSVKELLELSNKDIVHVHVNDAPLGLDIDEQVDNRRGLPMATGVIDMKGFIGALTKIGYDGPVECEPFDQELRDMDDDQALRKTIASLNQLWALTQP